MKPRKPPRLAERILQGFGPELNQEALTGDLNEAFQQGRSKGWYWRQVLAAIRWRRLMRPVLGSALMAWIIASDGSTPTLLSRPAEIALLTAAYFASLFAPGINRGRLKVLLALLLAASFGLLCFYKPYPMGYWTFFWVLACNFVSERKARASHRVTLRELVYGDPEAERQRLMEKLHLAMLQETDPQVRRAYAEAIAALKTHGLPTANAAQ